MSSNIQTTIMVDEHPHLCGYLEGNYPQQPPVVHAEYDVFVSKVTKRYIAFVYHQLPEEKNDTEVYYYISLLQFKEVYYADKGYVIDKVEFVPIQAISTIYDCELEKSQGNCGKKWCSFKHKKQIEYNSYNPVEKLCRVNRKIGCSAKLSSSGKNNTQVTQLFYSKILASSCPLHACKDVDEETVKMFKLESIDEMERIRITRSPGNVDNFVQIPLQEKNQWVDEASSSSTTSVRKTQSSVHSSKEKSYVKALGVQAPTSANNALLVDKEMMKNIHKYEDLIKLIPKDIENLVERMKTIDTRSTENIQTALDNNNLNNATMVETIMEEGLKNRMAPTFEEYAKIFATLAYVCKEKAQTLATAQRREWETKNGKVLEAPTKDLDDMFSAFK